MPQDGPEIKGDEAAIKAPFRVKKVDLPGFISKILLAVLNLPPASDDHDHKDLAGPSAMPANLRPGHSFTNHSSAPAEHHLPKGRGFGMSGQSLSNLLSHKPARQPKSIESVPAQQTVPDDTTVREVAQFYIVFLWSVAKRQEDIRGLKLQDSISEAVDSLICSLPENEQWILPDDWLRPEEYLSSIYDRLASGNVPALENVKNIYIRVLHELRMRLEQHLDGSTVKLLFRLAARDTMREREQFARKYSLLEGIPESYLKQLNPSGED
jgi:hypothetical protein